MAKYIWEHPWISGFVVLMVIAGAYFAVNANSPKSYTPMNANLTPVVRTLGTAYQLSDNNNYFCVYYIDLTVISALSGNNSATISIQTSTTQAGSYTTLVTAIAQVSGVLSTSFQTQSISAMIPKGMWVKLVATFSGVNANAAAYRYGLEYPLP